MRICHIIEAAGGGSGQVVLDLILANIAAGDEVTLIYSTGRAEHRFVSALPKERLKVFTTPMRREVGVHDALDFLHFFRLLKKTGPFDIVHSHSSKAGALARLAGLFTPRTPQVYSPHAFITMAPDAPGFYRRIEWLLSWLADDIICVSEQEMRHARNTLNITQRKLHVVPNGVRLDYNADKASARAAMGYDSREYIVGFAGRLVPQKNPARLLEAFAIIARERPDIKLAVVGEGHLRAQTEKSLADAGLMGNVRFFTDHNARDLMPGFDCLLVSSDYESFGLVILEAMAAGVPVVTTPVGIAADAVVDGTGHVTADFAPASLAFATLALAQLDGNAQAVIKEAAKAQATNFSTERMARMTRERYDALLARRQT